MIPGRPISTCQVSNENKSGGVERGGAKGR